MLRQDNPARQPHTSYAEMLRWVAIPFTLFALALLVCIVLLASCVPRAEPSDAMESAIAEGDLPRVKRLVREHPELANAEVVTDIGWRDSMLERAVHNRRHDIAEFLVKNGANVNYRDESQVTPLHSAVEEGDKKMVELLLMHGAGVGTKDRLGDTPLHAAARSEDPQIARLLLQAGADPNATDKKGTTPLDYVLHFGYKRTAEVLKQYHAEKGTGVRGKGGKGTHP